MRSQCPGRGIKDSVDIDLTGAVMDVYMGGRFYLAEGSGAFNNAFASCFFDSGTDLSK